MSSLSTSFTNGSGGHTAAHNATNTQANINAQVAVMQEVTHSSGGALVIDIEDGAYVRVTLESNITSLTFSNHTIGQEVLMFFVGHSVTDYLVDLSNIHLNSGNMLSQSTVIPASQVGKLCLVRLANSDLWAWDGLQLFNDALAGPQPLDPSRFDIAVLGRDTSTWGEQRTLGTWIVAANEFGPGDTTDQLQLGTGYNLNFEADDTTINGTFTMNDGADERLKQGVVGSVYTVETAGQYEEDGSYDHSNNELDGSNSGVNIDPSDAFYFDGCPRNELRFDDVPVTVGPAAVESWFSTSFQVEAWMTQNDFTSAIFSLESPEVEKTPPLLMSIRSDQLLINSKNATVPQTLEDPNPPFDQTIVAIDLPPVGEWCSVIMEFRVDPFGGSGFCQVWTVDNSGNLNQQVHYQSGYGWVYSDPTLNEQFFPVMLQMYQFHQFSPDGVTNNWNDVGNNVRRLRTALSKFYTGTNMTVTELADDIRYELGLPQP